MRRQEAIDILARHDLERLTPNAREELLRDWWTIDNEDPDYNSLPSRLREELARTDEPADATSLGYDPLLQLALRRSFVGVINSFLDVRLLRLGYASPHVEGSVERLEACPCCEHRSLLQRGGYEICKVCFWEDDGMNELDRVSGPNHMTLRQARQNFERFGAVTDDARSHVLPDGKERYAMK